METKTAKTNGQATKKVVKTILANGVKSKENKSTVPSSKTIQPKTEVKTEQKPIVKIIEPVVVELTLDQKIEKVENLKTLIEKRELLEASRKKLNSFVVGTNQFSESIILSDENGNSFKTSNTEVFTKVVETIKSTLVSKIAEIEEQIKF